MPQAQNQRRHLLVIDDDDIMREVLSTLLTIEGYNVHVVPSGDEALAYLADPSTQIDIILADLHMPGLHGADLARRLNAARSPHTLLIGMSGSRPNVEEINLYGAFLDKPFAMDDFSHALQAAAHSDASSAAAGQSLPAPPAGAAVLDETIFSRLAAMLAPTQMQELYRITITDVLRRVDIMRSAAQNGDFDTCRQEAHAIKGGCGMVGAGELAALAASVESTPALDNISLTSTGPRFTTFDAACARLQDMLDQRF